MPITHSISFLYIMLLSYMRGGDDAVTLTAEDVTAHERELLPMIDDIFVDVGADTGADTGADADGDGDGDGKPTSA
jgi:hypothetical protein